MTDTRDTPRPRTRARRTDPVTESAIEALLDAGEVTADRDLYSEMMRTVLRMARDGADRGDVKITNGALRELRSAYRRFAPYRATRKVSVFGSARTHPDDPAYLQAVELGEALARHGFMVITGGGPGIMTAAIEGAGRENSFVVTIRLPFEDSPPTLVDEERWVRFRYFFTRKLTFMKESSAYVVCPGGFGTMDETFELLTLIQTGKETPAPVVLIDPPDEAYWDVWAAFVADELLAGGLVSPEDLELVHRTSSVDDAADYIARFYRTYHSMRWVSGRLVIRLAHAISDAELTQLNGEYADIVIGGTIERSDVTPAELDDDDNVELPRLVMDFDNRHFTRLHSLVLRLADFGD